MINTIRWLGLYPLLLSFAVHGFSTRALAQEPQEPQEPPPKIESQDLSGIEGVYRKFFGALRTGSLTALNDSVKPDWVGEPSGISVGSGLNTFLNSAGAMTEYRLMRVESINDLGDSGKPADFYRLKFVAYHEGHPIAWLMEFVKWRGRWRIFRIDFETEFIFDFLAKSPLEFRALRAQSAQVLRRP